VLDACNFPARVCLYPARLLQTSILVCTLCCIIARSTFIKGIETLTNVVNLINSVLSDVLNMRSFLALTKSALVQLPATKDVLVQATAMVDLFANLSSSPSLLAASATYLSSGPLLVNVTAVRNALAASSTVLRPVFNVPPADVSSARFVVGLAATMGDVEATALSVNNSFATFPVSSWTASLASSELLVAALTTPQELPAWFSSMKDATQRMQQRLLRLGAIVDGVLPLADDPVVAAQAVGRAEIELGAIASALDAFAPQFSANASRVVNSVASLRSTGDILRAIMCKPENEAFLRSASSLQSLLAPGSVGPVPSALGDTADTLALLQGVMANVSALGPSPAVPNTGDFDVDLERLRVLSLTNVEAASVTVQKFIARSVNNLDTTLASALLLANSDSPDFITAFQSFGSHLNSTFMTRTVFEVLDLVGTVEGWLDSGTKVLSFIQRVLDIASKFPALADFADTVRGYTDKVQSVVDKVAEELHTATVFLLSLLDLANDGGKFLDTLESSANATLPTLITAAKQAYSTVQSRAVDVAFVMDTVNVDVGTPAFVKQYNASLLSVAFGAAAPFDAMIAGLTAAKEYTSQLASTTTPSGSTLRDAATAVVGVVNSGSIRTHCSAVTASLASSLSTLEAGSALLGPEAVGSLAHVAVSTRTLVDTYTGSLGVCPTCGVAALLKLQTETRAGFGLLSTTLALLDAVEADVGSSALVPLGAAAEVVQTAQPRLGALVTAAVQPRTVSTAAVLQSLDPSTVETSINTVRDAATFTRDAFARSVATEQSLQALRKTLGQVLDFATVAGSGTAGTPFVSSASVAAGFVTVVDSLTRYGDALANVSSNPLWGLCTLAFASSDPASDAVAGLLTKFNTIVGYVADKLKIVTEVINQMRAKVDKVEGVVGTIRNEFLSLSNELAISEALKAPKPDWCKLPPSGSVGSSSGDPPCMHMLQRTPQLVRRFAFPINFALLYYLTLFSKAGRVFQAPGAYDGYVLAGSTYCGPSTVVTVHNPDEGALGGGTVHSPLAVVNKVTNNVWAISVVFELPLPSAGQVTGTATRSVSGSTCSVLVSVSTSASAGQVLKYTLDTSKSNFQIADKADKVLSTTFSPGGGLSVYEDATSCKMYVMDGKDKDGKAFPYPCDGTTAGDPILVGDYVRYACFLVCMTVLVPWELGIEPGVC
jgi:hypothetical protein